MNVTKDMPLIDINFVFTFFFFFNSSISFCKLIELAENISKIIIIKNYLMRLNFKSIDLRLFKLS